MKIIRKIRIERGIGEVVRVIDRTVGISRLRPLVEILENDAIRRVQTNGEGISKRDQMIIARDVGLKRMRDVYFFILDEKALEILQTKITRDTDVEYKWYSSAFDFYLIKCLEAKQTDDLELANRFKSLLHILFVRLDKKERSVKLERIDKTGFVDEFKQSYIIFRTQTEMR